MTINGFETEIYNQYKFPENVKYATCPLCSEHRKKKLEKCVKIYWDKALACCFHCGETMQLHTYKKKSEERVVYKPYKKPAWNNNTDLSDDVVKFFEKRNISQKTLKIAKVSQGRANMPPEWKERKVICFNYFREGELINIKYRTSDKKFMLVKDAELILYNLDNAKISDEIILVEGELDALAYIEAGIIDVVSVPNGSTLNSVNLDYLDNCIEYFENKKKIYLSLDNDAPGQNVTKELIRRLGSSRCYTIDLKDCKDANDYLIKYGSVSLAYAKESAKEVPLEGVSSVLDWKDDFKDYLLNGMRSGYRTGITSFDRIFSTYTGQYIVVTGIPSSGKSEFVDSMCIGYYLNYGWRIAIASPENKPNKIHAGKIISKLCGEWVNRQEQVSQLWYQKAVEKINDMFKYIDLDDGYDLDIVLEKTKELILKYGIKVLVIDPFNKVRLKVSLKKNINEYTNDYLIRLDEFARKHDILIILVAHPNKPSGEDRKNYEPDFYNIKGGGEFYDMSPHGILVHRDYENHLVKVKVLKVKFSHLGRNNEYVYLKWNEHNGRYSDFQSQSKKPEELVNLMIDNSNWIVEKSKKDSQTSLDLSKPTFNHYYEPQKEEIDENRPFGDTLETVPF